MPSSGASGTKGQNARWAVHSKLKELIDEFEKSKSAMMRRTRDGPPRSVQPSPRGARRFRSGHYRQSQGTGPGRRRDSHARMNSARSTLISLKKKVVGLRGLRQSHRETSLASPYRFRQYPVCATAPCSRSRATRSHRRARAESVILNPDSDDLQLPGKNARFRAKQELSQCAS